jgi:hypothetical protein
VSLKKMARFCSSFFAMPASAGNWNNFYKL